MYRSAREDAAPPKRLRWRGARDTFGRHTISLPVVTCYGDSLLPSLMPSEKKDNYSERKEPLSLSLRPHASSDRCKSNVSARKTRPWPRLTPSRYFWLALSFWGTLALFQSNNGTPPLDKLPAKHNLVFNPRAKVRIPDADRSMAFLHIGKTGGSTISMNIRNGCHAQRMGDCKDRTEGWTPHETIASRRIQAYYHMDGIPSSKLNEYTTVVTSVRNPISRFLSAFAYEHPANRFATKVPFDDDAAKQMFSCFPTTSALVRAAVGQAEIPFVDVADLTNKNPRRLRALRSITNVTRIDCTELAKLAFGNNESKPVVEGNHTWVNHMTQGYRHYYKSMSSDKELIVLRTESLYKDWKNFNRLLMPSRIVPPFRSDRWGAFRDMSKKYAHRERWEVQTEEERTWLCELLEEEIRTYLTMIARAVNLDEEDLREAAAGIDAVCAKQEPDSHQKKGVRRMKEKGSLYLDGGDWSRTWTYQLAPGVRIPL